MPYRLSARVLVLVGLAIPATAVGAWPRGDEAPQQVPRAPSFGTAAITGVVVAADDPAKPVRRAIVKLSGLGELSRGAITDDEGRFAIGSLPTGTYTLTVSKSAHLTTTFGAKGPGRAGTPIVLSDGQTMSDLRVLLVRGAVITGTIRDHTGEPAREIWVFVVRADGALTPTVQSASRVETVTTDDTGTYRIWGLPPGTYIVGATPKNGWEGVSALTPEHVDAELRALQQRTSGIGLAAPAASAPAPLNYVPVYHPSATSPAQAVKVALAPGEERGGIDVSLMLVPIATIEGLVLGADGQPTSAVALDITSPGAALPSTQGLAPYLAQRPGADGVFRYAGVAPGTYTVSARSSSQVVRTSSTGTPISITNMGAVPSTGTIYWAASTVEVNGGDLRGVTLQLRPSLTMIGRVVFDAGALKPPADVTQVRLSLTPEGVRSAGLAATSQTGSPQADGRFELTGLTPGRYAVAAQVPGGLGPNGWWLRSAVVDGRDLLDRPLEIGDTDLANVVLTFSDRHTELTGTLTAADGRPAPDFVIVALPENRALWSSTRRVQLARPATNGRFAFTDLPPGNYLIGALTDVADENWRTEDFLATVAPATVKVTIGEGEKKLQDLRIGK